MDRVDKHCTESLCQCVFISDVPNMLDEPGCNVLQHLGQVLLLFLIHQASSSKSSVMIPSPTQRNSLHTHVSQVCPLGLSFS